MLVRKKAGWRRGSRNRNERRKKNFLGFRHHRRVAARVSLAEPRLSGALAPPSWDAVDPALPPPTPLAAEYMAELEFMRKSGFLLKLSRMPPFLMAPPKEWPLSSDMALDAVCTSSNSTKHIGPLDLSRNENWRKPRQLLKTALSWSSICESTALEALLGRLPTNNVLTGGWLSPITLRPVGLGRSGLGACCGGRTPAAAGPSSPEGGELSLSEPKRVTTEAGCCCGSSGLAEEGGEFE